MYDLRELHRVAADAFGRRVHAIGDEQWASPTPCAEWTVRDLVRHLVYENRWAPDLMAGATVEEVGDRYEGDLLGEDPKAAWRDAVGPALIAFETDGALDSTVHLSYGDERGSEYLSQLILDHAVHAWDLARAIGDDDRLDPRLVEFLWETWEPRRELLGQTGLFAEEVPVPPDADTQTKLLALLGRHR